MKHLLLLFSLAASTWGVTAQATSINPADLPSAVQSCLGTGQCGVNLSSSFEQTVPGAGSIAAFQWTDFRSGSPEAKYLVRYNLAPGSNNTFTGVDAYGSPLPTQTTALTGNLWLGVNESYALPSLDLSTQYATMSLFLDQTQVSTNPWLGATAANGELALRMNATDLLAGSASSSANCCSGGGTTTGSLQVADGYGGWQGALPCVADGCSTSALLNLIDLQYGLSDIPGGVGALLAFNGTDPRSLLYKATLNDPYSGDGTSTYLVRPVPEPASVLLWGLGLVGLAVGSRRRTVR